MSIPNKIETNNLWLQGRGGRGRDRQRGWNCDILLTSPSNCWWSCRLRPPLESMARLSPWEFINLFSVEGVLNIKSQLRGLQRRRSHLQSFSFPIRCVPILTSKLGWVNSMFLKLHWFKSHVGNKWFSKWGFSIPQAAKSAWAWEEEMAIRFLERSGISKFCIFLTQLAWEWGWGGSPAAWSVSHLNFELWTILSNGILSFEGSITIVVAIITIIINSFSNDFGTEWLFLLKFQH